MTLKCTVDGSQESPGHLIIYACHHCGKPVCEQHGWVVPADDGFDDSAEDQGRRVPQAVRTVKRVPQPAMHCKQCVDKDHPKASKHPRWVDPKEAQRQAAQARGAQQQAGGQPGQQYPPQQGQPWGQPGQQYPPQQGQPWGQPGQQYPPQQGQPWGQPGQQYPPQQGQYPPQQ